MLDVYAEQNEQLLRGIKAGLEIKAEDIKALLDGVDDVPYDARVYVSQLQHLRGWMEGVVAIVALILPPEKADG